MSSPSLGHDDQAVSPKKPLGYVPSDSLWRGYLRCHRAISRQVAHLHRAGGAAWTVGKLLYKMQNQRLYRAQFASLGECAQGEWQLNPELLKGLLQLSQTHSQEEAAKAGALPLLVLRGLAEQAQGGTLDQVLQSAQPGQTDLQTALRAAKDAEREGATKEQARVIYDNTLSRLKQEREQRTNERQARDQALKRKPFAPIDWLEPLEEGASAESIERQTQVKAELRNTAKGLRQTNGGIRQLSALLAKCGPEVRLKGAEPLAVMEDALSVYLHLPALLSRMALHLPDEAREKWLHDLPGDPALVKAYERACQSPDQPAEPEVPAPEPEASAPRAKRPENKTATKQPRRRRSGFLVSILFLISLFGVPTKAAPGSQEVVLAYGAPPDPRPSSPSPPRTTRNSRAGSFANGTTSGRFPYRWPVRQEPWVGTQTTWVWTQVYLGRNPGILGRKPGVPG